MRDDLHPPLEQSSSQAELAHLLARIDYKRQARLLESTLDAVGIQFKEDTTATPSGIALEVIDRLEGWRRQIFTPFSELTEEERAPYLEPAYALLELIEQNLEPR